MATYKYVDTQDNLYKLQWDALRESIANNPYLPSSTNSLTNKSLNTTNKRIIGAINEILTNSNSTSKKVDDFVTRFNDVIGNEVIYPELLEQLRKIDENFFKVILKIYNELETLNNENLIGINERIDLAIDELNRKIANIDNSESYTSNFEETATFNVDTQIIYLSHIPRTKNSISLFINGIYYPTTCYNLYKDGSLGWFVPEDGFLLEADFEIVVRYDYV